MDVDESFVNEEPTHKCYLCNETFKTKDDLKKHTKSKHPISVPLCGKFMSSKCERSEQQCWYKHESKESNSQQKSKESNSQKKSKPTAQNEQVFYEATQNAFPPDQAKKMMEALNNLCLKVEKMEKRFKDLMN